VLYDYAQLIEVTIDYLIIVAKALLDLNKA